MPIKGRFINSSTDKIFDLSCNIEEFPLKIASAFIYRPIVRMSAGKIKGIARIYGTKKNPEIFNLLSAKEELEQLKNKTGFEEGAEK